MFVGRIKKVDFIFLRHEKWRQVWMRTTQLHAVVSPLTGITTPFLACLKHGLVTANITLLLRPCDMTKIPTFAQVTDAIAHILHTVNICTYCSQNFALYWTALFIWKQMNFTYFFKLEMDFNGSHFVFCLLSYFVHLSTLEFLSCIESFLSPRKTETHIFYLLKVKAC